MRQSRCVRACARACVALTPAQGYAGGGDTRAFASSQAPPPPRAACCCCCCAHLTSHLHSSFWRPPIYPTALRVLGVRVWLRAQGRHGYYQRRHQARVPTRGKGRASGNRASRFCLNLAHTIMTRRARSGLRRRRQTARAPGKPRCAPAAPAPAACCVLQPHACPPGPALLRRCGCAAAAPDGTLQGTPAQAHAARTHPRHSGPHPRARKGNNASAHSPTGVWQSATHVQWLGAQEVPGAKKEFADLALNMAQRKAQAGSPGTLTISPQGLSWVKVRGRALLPCTQ